MSDGDALLRAILRQPEEDTPRLVYADWCDENGQPHRAECIRAQIKYAQGGGWTPATCVRDVEEKQWLGFPRECCLDCGWWRGFVESVTCTAADWLQYGDTIRAAHPVTRVRLTDHPSGNWAPVFYANKGGLHVRVAGRELRAPSGHAADILAARWPGVTFEIPLSTFAVSTP
jgi:uncharacterized protein (TIGR02996 family)